MQQVGKQEYLISFRFGIFGIDSSPPLANRVNHIFVILQSSYIFNIIRVTNLINVCMIEFVNSLCQIRVLSRGQS